MELAELLLLEIDVCNIPIMDPWCWCIYANIGDILMVNVTIYSSTMDPSWDWNDWNILEHLYAKDFCVIRG